MPYERHAGDDKHGHLQLGEAVIEGKRRSLQTPACVYRCHFLAQIPVLGNPVVLAIADQIITLLLVTVVFALIYKVLPDVKIAWPDVWVGAAVTAVLFVIGEALIAWYLAVAGVASAYGAAGSLLVGLLWIYYSSIILLLGAEFTKVAAGHAQTVAPSNVRTLSEQPPGVDPRVVGKTTPKELDRGPRS